MRKQREDILLAVPYFDAFMWLAGASMDSLAKASGVSHQTITKLRGGGAIKRVLADILVQTLEERVFVSYESRRFGPRGKYRPRSGPTSAYKWVNRVVKPGGM